MRSLHIARYGGPEVMELIDVPEPVPGPEDVLIRVHAAGLNPIDWKFRERKAWPAVNPKLPVGLGCDVAGVVTAVGARVTTFAPGVEVFARLEKDRMGGFSDFVAAKASVVARKPTQASMAEAAALPLAGLTALQALRLMPEAKSVLVHAGSGGVGSLAIQLAKLHGLRVLTTTSAKNVDFVRALGADEVIDYRREDVSERARGVDAVFDTLGDPSELAALSLVAPGGVVVGVSGTPSLTFARESLPWFTRPVIWLRTRAREHRIRQTGTHYHFLFMKPDGQQLAEIAAWVDQGRLRPVVSRVFPLESYQDAFAALETGHARGKIVFDLDVD